VALFAVLILHVKTYTNMSTPYKGYFSFAVCEGISKNGWLVGGVLFFSTSQFFTIWWVLWEKIIIIKLGFHAW
jgi:hypothetical protein